MTVLSHQIQQEIPTMYIFEQQPAVDIDSILHMGHQETEKYTVARGSPTQTLPRLNKSQYTTMPFDIDHLVTLGKNTMDYRRADSFTPTIQATTKESMVPGLLSNESIDSLSSEDSALTCADILPKTPSETSLSIPPVNLSSRPLSSPPIMDIDHLIQIGTYPDSLVPSRSAIANNRRTLDVERFFEQSLSSESSTNGPEIIEMDMENLPVLSTRHTFPLSSKSRQFLLNHRSLDIDNLIEIGVSSKPNVGGELVQSEKVDSSTRSAPSPTLQRPSASRVSRPRKSRFWVKCLGKLKKALFI
ncbi:hypothetical protein K493DRAFT_316985 [Basidiobolus meristosporus CBS 931.73]|uniref:Uncharacterized protein n=1 Tax=Basidiobolus meristosporus CBS 931.73 TaxID=1314790 RepID=A0A1Y1Y1G8_9FUNG|nr:hypothetical protein K493DRAFT_316985 [Basidiobolus meristosporus CBS 931.73]|eukprot:ORX91861.1 hypothetical protein K493DRAFT_316985 [Basidiobolus meristosporus CBS 931.73]